VFVHGRKPDKVKATVEMLKAQSPFPGAGDVEGFVADLASFKDVRKLAQEMADRCVRARASASCLACLGEFS